MFRAILQKKIVEKLLISYSIKYERARHPLLKSIIALVATFDVASSHFDNSLAAKDYTPI